ncbi:MAG: GNAT family N-acetyltransferase [Bacteroidales bacterium]|nr:GNAT family N-acetyltransferase [Bacteroidales bacterium]
MENTALQHLENKIIENSEVYLRILRKEDIDSFKKITQDKLQWKYFTHDLSNEETLANWIDELLKDYEDKKCVPFTIINKETGKVVGSTSVTNYSSEDKSIEITSTWSGKDSLGTGLIQTSGKLLIACCFDNLDITRVDFKVDILNIPAKRSLLKIKGVQEYAEKGKTTDDFSMYFCLYKKDFSG